MVVMRKFLVRLVVAVGTLRNSKILLSAIQFIIQSENQHPQITREQHIIKNDFIFTYYYQKASQSISSLNKKKVFIVQHQLSKNNLMIYNRLVLRKANQKLQVYAHPEDHEIYFHLYDISQFGRHYFKSQPSERVIKHFKSWKKEFEGVLESDVEIDYRFFENSGKILLKIKGYQVQLKQQSKGETQQRVKREQKLIEQLKKKMEAEERAKKINKEKPQTSNEFIKSQNSVFLPKQRNIQNHAQFDTQNKWRTVKEYDQFSPQSAVFQLKTTYKDSKDNDKIFHTYGTGVAITYHSIFTCAHNIYYVDKKKSLKLQCQYVEILRNNTVLATVYKQELRMLKQYKAMHQGYRRYDFALLFVKQIPCAFHPLKLLTNFEDIVIARIIGFPFMDKGNTGFQGRLQAKCEKVNQNSKQKNNYISNASCDIVVLREKDILTKGIIYGVMKSETNKKEWPIKGKLTFKNPKRYKSDKLGQSCFQFKGELILNEENEKQKQVWKVQGALQGHQFPSKQNAMKYEIYTGNRQRNSQYNQDIYRLRNAQNWLKKHQDGFIWHKITSSKGQSGSPLIVQYYKGQYFMIGIHIADFKQDEMNVAIPLNGFVMGKIQWWELQFQQNNPDHKYLRTNCELQVFDFKKSQHFPEHSSTQRELGFSHVSDQQIKKMIGQIEQKCENRKFISAFQTFQKVKEIPLTRFKDDEIQQLLTIALEKIVKAFCQFKHFIDMKQDWRNDVEIKKYLDKTIQKMLQYIKSEGQNPFFYNNLEYFQLKIKILKEMLLHECGGQTVARKKAFKDLLLEIDKVQGQSKNKYNPDTVPVKKSVRRYQLLRYDCHMRLAMQQAAHRNLDLAMQSYFTAVGILEFSKLIKKNQASNIVLFRQIFQKYYIQLDQGNEKSQKGKEKNQESKDKQFQNHVECLMVFLEELRIKGQLYDMDQDLNAKLNIIERMIQKRAEIQFTIELLSIIRKYYKFKTEYWENKLKEKKKTIK